MLFIFCKVTMVVDPIQMKTLIKVFKKHRINDNLYTIIVSVIPKQLTNHLLSIGNKEMRSHVIN